MRHMRPQAQHHIRNKFNATFEIEELYKQKNRKNKSEKEEN